MNKPRKLRTGFRRTEEGQWFVASNMPLTFGAKVEVPVRGGDTSLTEIGEPVPQDQLPKGVAYGYRVVDRSSWLFIDKRGGRGAFVFSRAALPPWSIIQVSRGMRFVEIGEPLHLDPAQVRDGYTHAYRVTNLNPRVIVGRTPIPVPLSIVTAQDNHLGFAQGN